MESTMDLAKPKPIWSRNVKLDVKPFFVSLAKGVAHAATLKVDELGSDAVDALASLGLDSPVEELAYVLVKRATMEALLSLTRESASHLNPGLCNSGRLSSETEFLLDGLTISFGRDFFRRPGSAIFVDQIVNIYLQWLIDNGVGEFAAKSIASRYPAYFTFALVQEWRANAPKYGALIDLADSPFSEAEAVERGWLLYFSYLKKRVSESIFDEPFGLSQIYVPLNAYYLLPKEKNSKDSPVFDASKKRHCVRLDEEIRDWLGAKDKSDAIRVVSGGPGSGKSSFTKMLCCEIAESGLAKPIYVPLHLIDPTREVAQEVERFIRDEGLIGFNPLDPDRKETGLLLVFDGLDELASTGKVAAQVARDFVQAVERMVERRNLGPYPIFVVLSGRELIVQENETEFRRPRQVLTVLPYHVVDEKSRYVDPKNLLDEDLRQAWWDKYGNLIGKQYGGLPQELRLQEIDEITSQPLLNYLVALSYLRGSVDFSHAVNLNSVYADLVAAVHERAYEKSRTFRPISHLKLGDFVRVLEEIGLAAWHGSDGRSTSVKDIMAHCKQSGLESLLKSFTEGAQAGVTKLLAAFFFRRNGENVGDDAAFVFTHKSFGEYLTACRIVRGLERIVVERKRRLANADDGFDINDALTYWLKLAGPAQMTEYLKKFLYRELERRQDLHLEEWQRILQELMGAAVEKLVPVENLGNLSYSASVRYEVNSSTALLIALNACSENLKKPAKISFVNETSFGTFLRRVCPQRSGPQSPLLYSALSYLDLSGQCLDMADLYGADLRHTKWEGCRAHFANFGTATFVACDFKNAVFSWSRFDSATFVDGNFLETGLIQVNFSGARFVRTSFLESDLRDSDFNGSKLSGCSFEGVSLADTNLDECESFERCRFEKSSVSSDNISVIQWFQELKKRELVEGNIETKSPSEVRLHQRAIRAKSAKRSLLGRRRDPK